MMMVLLENWPVYSITAYFVILSTSLVWSLVFSPLDEKIKNWTVAFSNFSVMIMMGLLVLEQNTRDETYGNWFIAFGSFTSMISCILALVRLFYLKAYTFLKDLFKKYEERRKTISLEMIQKNEAKDDESDVEMQMAQGSEGEEKREESEIDYSGGMEEGKRKEEGKDEKQETNWNELDEDQKERREDIEQPTKEELRSNGREGESDRDNKQLRGKPQGELNQKEEELDQKGEETNESMQDRNKSGNGEAETLDYEESFKERSGSRGQKKKFTGRWKVLEDGKWTLE